MRRSEQTKPNTQLKSRKTIIISTFVLTMLATFAVAYYNIPAFKAKEINGTVLKGVLDEQIVFPEITDAILAPGETFTFDIAVQYTDKDGKSARGEIEDKSDLAMRFSDVALCDRPSYNVIKIKEDAQVGKLLKISMKYGSKEKVYDFIIAYSLEDTVDSNGVVTNADNIAVLLNSNRKMPSDYVPKSLRAPSIKYQSGSVSLCGDAASAAEEMFTAAKKGSLILIAVKGYAGYSSSDPEHQTGYALDVTSISSDYSTSSRFANSKEGQWLVQNAYKYGYIVRYPADKESQTGHSYSPSHLRYVGIEFATYLHDNNLCLEEFFSR